MVLSQSLHQHEEGKYLKGVGFVFCILQCVIFCREAGDDGSFNFCKPGVLTLRVH